MKILTLVNVIVLWLSNLTQIGAQVNFDDFKCSPLLKAPDKEQQSLMLKHWPVMDKDLKVPVAYDLASYFAKDSWKNLENWRVDVIKVERDFNINFVEIKTNLCKANVNIEVYRSRFEALTRLWGLHETSTLPDEGKMQISRVIGDASLSNGELEANSGGVAFARGNVFVQIHPIIRDPNAEKQAAEYQSLVQVDVKEPTDYTSEEREKMEKVSAEMEKKYSKMANPERDADMKGASKLVADLARMLDKKIQKAIKEEQDKGKK